MPFLINEDRALKLKLQGLVVHDATAPPAGRKVTVRFRNPEYELADAVYPLVMIEHVRISRSEEREMRGPVSVHYAPEGYPGWPDMTDPQQSPYQAESPIPLDIDYQVDAYCRKELHLIELVDQMVRFHRIPHRFGYVAVPEDGTVRRLDVLGGPEFSESKDELGKRLFAASWSIRVSSEIFLSEILTLTEAQKVLLEIVDKPDFDQGIPSVRDTAEVRRVRLEVGPRLVPTGQVGEAYRFRLAAVGGEEPYVWSLSPGSRLPEGLFFSAQGWLFGTPVSETLEPFAFTVMVKDSAYSPQVAEAVLTISVRPAPPGS